MIDATRETTGEALQRARQWLLTAARISLSGTVFENQATLAMLVAAYEMALHGDADAKLLLNEWLWQAAEADLADTFRESGAGATLRTSFSPDALAPYAAWRAGELLDAYPTDHAAH